MEILMKELFEKKCYKLQSEDTYIKTLQSGQDIFRSSDTDETTKQSSRLKTEIYLNPTYLKNEYPLIPNFFGPKHTALIYGFANDSKLYSYTLKRDLKLIGIDTSFLDMLWERTRLNLEDKELVLRFFTILGYVPSTLKGEKMTWSVWLTGATILGLSVAATASEVLPWNAPLKATTFFLPV